MNKAVIIIAALLVALCVFTACTKAEKKSGGGDGENSNVTAYRYDNPKQCDYINIKKAEYSDKKLKLYLSFDGDAEIDYVECFDEDLGRMDEGSFTYKNGVLTIRHPKAESISGLIINTKDDMRYALRYLNSEQFSGLYYIFAYDIGFIECGDKEAYYTEEEMQAFADEAAATERRSREAFEMLEGHWLCEDGRSYLDFYEVPEYRCFAMLSRLYSEDSDEPDSYETYIEDFTYYFSESDAVYHISGSTGNMTVPVFVELFGEGSRLTIEWSDFEFIKE